MEIFLQTFLVNPVNQFLVLNFRGGFWRPWRKVSEVDNLLSSHKRENYPTTTLDENCIKFDFQMSPNS